MKIYADSSDQTLICIDYDFGQDCPAFRGLSRQRFGRGINDKGTWNYTHTHYGLRVLVAYEGPRAVGQVEFLPIEHAPRPVTGTRLMFITCLAVRQDAAGRGIGSALLAACRDEAEQHTDGLAALAYTSGPFMPAGFFARHGFVYAGQRDGTRLMYLPWAEVQPPQMLPSLYKPRLRVDKVVVDYFWCGQCPYTERTRERLRQAVRQMGPAVELHEINTDDPATLERWGISDGLFIDGRNAFGFPPRLAEWEIRQALQEALESH